MQTLFDFLLKYWYFVVPIAVLATLVLFLSILNIRRSRKQAKQAEQTKQTAPPKGKDDKEEQGWFKKYLWTIGLSLAGAIIFYVWLYTPGLRFAQVGEWSWDHWLALPAFVGILYVLITNCAGYLGPLAKMLQGGLVGAVLLMYLGIPAGLWVRDAFLPQVICPDVSSQEPRSCNLNTAWSSWAKAAEGPAVDGMRMCASPGGQSERKDEGGITFFRFRANEGRLVKAYRLYPGPQKCPVTIS